MAVNIFTKCNTVNYSLAQHAHAISPYKAPRRKNQHVCRSVGPVGPETVGHETEKSALIDQDFVDELNRVSNKTLEVITAGSDDAAFELSAELQQMRHILEEENDVESSKFIGILQKFLDHTVPKDADTLQGVYARAVDRILNQAAGSSWKLVEEGKSATPKEPQFSTWDDIFNGKKQAGSQQQATSDAKDTSLYMYLGVESDAEPAAIKAAFRKKALQLHPDVNTAEDANERFSEISHAYDVLSDATSRELYDKYGEGMGSMQGAAAGRGNAREAWDEFKPFKRENKHTRARSTSHTASSTSAGNDANGNGTDARDGTPQVGDIVEYPLRTIETEDFQDGRSHGVGLLVSRNVDRGDVKTLPEDQLSLCEIESLRQEDPDSNRWVADELGISSFAKLEDMRVLQVSEFNSRHDVWTIETELSAGCGGPPLPEEIIL